MVRLAVEEALADVVDRAVLALADQVGIVELQAHPRCEGGILSHREKLAAIGRQHTFLDQVIVDGANERNHPGQRRPGWPRSRRSHDMGLVVCPGGLGLRRHARVAVRLDQHRDQAAPAPRCVRHAATRLVAPEQLGDSLCIDLLRQ